MPCNLILSAVVIKIFNCHTKYPFVHNKSLSKASQKLKQGGVPKGNLRAVLPTTAGTQRAIERNTYLKMNWAATIESLIDIFANMSIPEPPVFLSIGK